MVDIEIKMLLHRQHMQKQRQDQDNFGSYTLSGEALSVTRSDIVVPKVWTAKAKDPLE